MKKVIWILPLVTLMLTGCGEDTECMMGNVCGSPEDAQPVPDGDQDMGEALDDPDAFIVAEGGGGGEDEIEEPLFRCFGDFNYVPMPQEPFCIQRTEASNQDGFPRLGRTALECQLEAQGLNNPRWRFSLPTVEQLAFAAWPDAALTHEQRVEAITDWVLRNLDRLNIGSGQPIPVEATLTAPFGRVTALVDGVLDNVGEFALSDSFDRYLVFGWHYDTTVQGIEQMGLIRELTNDLPSFVNGCRFIARPTNL